jgi:hypothetical protein
MIPTDYVTVESIGPPCEPLALLYEPKRKRRRGGEGRESRDGVSPGNLSDFFERHAGTRSQLDLSFACDL